MSSYPMDFFAFSKATPGIQENWKTSQTFPDATDFITAAIPPEFGGPGKGFSPEDFYAMALSNCFVATWKVFAEKSNLNYASLTVELILTIDVDEQKRPWMKKAKFLVNLTGVENKDRAERLLNKVSQSCIVLNSVKTEKEFSFLVTQ